MAEDTKLKGSLFNGELERAKNQIEVDQEITKEFIKKVKDFLIGKHARKVPSESIYMYVYIFQCNVNITDG